MQECTVYVIIYGSYNDPLSRLNYFSKFIGKKTEVTKL